MTPQDRLANMLVDQNNISHAFEKAAAGMPMTSNVAKWLRSTLGMNPAVIPQTMGQRFIQGAKGSMGTLASGAGKILPLVALSGLAYGIPYLGAKGIDAVQDAAEVKKIVAAKKMMYEQDPTLMEDPDLAEKHFDILRTFSPSMAAHPVVAASYVRGAMQGGDFTHPDEIGNLIRTESGSRDLKERKSMGRNQMLGNFSRFLRVGDQ